MRKIIVKCKELKEEGIPIAIVNKLERKEAYNTNHRERITAKGRKGESLKSLKL
jgi:precorrin isomerase